ncbi:MAG TPA: type II toxin-antitoxin system VapB family antitoxin [Thermosynergistes sp.]|nr:type II toxin-antitoxin system VapB family antitoxin [Thermosynergistes sp.]
MRLSVTVDPELLEEAKQLAKAKNKREAIELALREFVLRWRLKNLAELAGSGLVEMDVEELKRWRESGVGKP